MIVSKSNKIKIDEIAKKYGLTYKEVEAIIKSPFEFIRVTTSKMDLGTSLNSEELSKIKTNFNIPCIGKLHFNGYQYRNINKLNEKTN